MKRLSLLSVMLLALALHGADDARFVPLALEPVGGKSLGTYGPDQPWSSVPQGRQTFDGVPFDVLAKLQLHGNTDARDNRFYPARVIGIPVQQRLARLHVLHGANISETNGKPIAALRLHYTGGTTHTLFVTYGVHVRNWWKNRGETSNTVSDTNSSVVWTGRSVDADKTGATHRLYKTSFDLPASDQPVESIGAFSLFSKSSEIILALTGEAPSAGVKTGTPLASADDAQFRDELVVKVADIAGNIVGGARVRGTALDERGLSTTLGRMDDSYGDIGVVAVDFPANSRELRLAASAPGYVPAEVNLKASAGQPMRREVSAKVEPGVRIGGFVRDVGGKPLAKAKVEMFRATQSALTGLSLFKYEENTTDTQGRWRMREAPESLDSLLFRVTLTDFRRGEYEFSGDTGTGTLTREALLNSRAEFKLMRTLSVAGTMRDESGRLLTNIMILLTRTNFGGTSSTSTRTDTRGAFRFRSVEPETATLVVNGTNYAPLVRAVDPEQESGSISLVLKPGTPLKGRFIGLSERGSTNARVNVNITSPSNALVRWNGFADAEGRFVWSHAPEGLLRIAAYHPGSPSRNFTARAGTGEAVFDMSATFTWRVRGIDADTKAPLADFSVIPGYFGGEDRVNWQPYSAMQGTNGEATLTDRGSEQWLKVEAPGYTPVKLPMLERDPSVSNVFALHRATPIKGVVKLPNGEPAAGAEIATPEEGHLTLGRGKFHPQYDSRMSNLVLKADAQGRFELMPRISERIVIVHESGYAETTQSNLAGQATVTLQPWGTVEGVLMVGSKPGTNVEVRLSENRNGMGLNYDQTFGAVTDSAGKFQITHVPPGTRWLNRVIAFNPNARGWSHNIPVNVQASGVTQITMGGNGRPVVGKVVPDDTARAIDWTQNFNTIYTVRPQPVFRTAAESRAWLRSPEGRAAQEDYRTYAALFETNGTFRVDDVPPGKYQFYFYFNEPRDPARLNSGWQQVGSVSHQFEVPDLPSGRSDEPLDLGKLELKTRR